MLKKYSSQLLLSVVLFTTGSAFGQNSTSKKEPGKDLVVALSRITRLPKPIAEEGASYAFALKFVFSENGKIDSIFSSKYTPKEIRPGLIHPSQYQQVNWEGIFHRKVGKGDILIVPVSIYNPESSKMLPEYNVDDLLNFNFPKEGEKFTPCLVMQTIVFKYRNLQ